MSALVCGVLFGSPTANIYNWACLPVYASNGFFRSGNTDEITPYFAQKKLKLNLNMTNLLMTNLC